MIGHKISLNIYKKTNHIKYFFQPPWYKLEMDNRRKTGKFTNMWKLNNTLLNNQWVKEEIKREI